MSETMSATMVEWRRKFCLLLLSERLKSTTLYYYNLNLNILAKIRRVKALSTRYRNSGTIIDYLQETFVNNSATVLWRVLWMNISK